MIDVLQNSKWRTLIGLLLIYSTVVLYPNYQWLWATLFLYWVVLDLFSGSSYFMEPLHRTENPVLYWIVILTWLTLSIYILVEALI